MSWHAFCKAVVFSSTCCNQCLCFAVNGNAIPAEVPNVCCFQCLFRPAMQAGVATAVNSDFLAV